MKHYLIIFMASILIISSCKKSDDARPADSPSAAFTFTKTSVLPINAVFVSTASSPNPIVSYMWNFGDPASGVNNSSALQNPIHQYYAEGTYAVTQTITDNTGVIETATQSVAATLRPNNIAPANFTFSTSPTFLVTFTNNSTSATSYKWFFDDGIEALNDSATVHHYYFYPATYHVRLVAYGSTNDTLTVPVVIP